MSQFKRHHKVRFAEADYSGIMFYPRYFEGLNATVEDWFGDIAGFPFERMLDEYDIGTPLIAVDAKFVSPSRLGDELVFSLSVASLGTSSITFDIEVSCGNERRMRSSLTHVCVKRDVSGAIPWPSDIKKKISQLIDKGE